MPRVPTKAKLLNNLWNWATGFNGKSIGDRSAIELRDSSEPSMT